MNSSVKISKGKGFFKSLEHLIGRAISNKRQRLILSVITLSIGLFIAEHVLGKSGVLIVIVLSFLTVFLLFASLREDLKGNFTPQTFILPFFYSLAMGLFYLLVPARLITRIAMTSLYALGLYSLFLSENIFTVSSIRTIALLSGARTVALVLSLLSYFFLTNVVFSLHINVFVTLLLIFLYTLPMIMQSIWRYSLEKNPLAEVFWVLSLTICLVEISLFLWFREGSPTVLALFLTAMFYVLVGLSQAWFEKRLFRSVILEYFWVTFVAFAFLVLFGGTLG